MAVTLINQRMQQCCCGCTVKTGSLIIGILEFVSAIASLGSAGNIDSSSALGGTQIASGVITLLITICLMYGVHSDKKTFLLPWIVVRGISIIILPFAILAFIIAIFILGQHMLLIFAAIVILFFALSCYLWKCVWSYYLDLSDAEAPQTMQA